MLVIPPQFVGRPLPEPLPPPRVYEGEALVELVLQEPPYLHGTVTLDSNPVKDLALTITRQRPESPSRRYSAITGLDGNFQFDVVEPGRYSISTQDPQYAIGIPNENFGIVEPVQNFQVQVYPLSYVTGRIIDNAGQPLALSLFLESVPLSLTANNVKWSEVQKQST